MNNFWNLYWNVDGKKFHNKRDALIYSSKNGIGTDKINLHYFDDVWKNFNRSSLGKIKLNDLYRDRAQQLRDTYDYLILYYSGGADSHNILMTFINNNIHLDEICVKWPKILTDNKFYTPNILDKSARNYWSEWDFAIKPSLDWVSKNYPKIKISIKDYVENPEKIKIESLFEKMNFVRPGGMLLNSITSDSEKNLRLRKIAHIYGIDKPLIAFKDNKFYMFFIDVALDQAVHSNIDPSGTECFYWTPNMPILAFEQAYQMVSFFKKNQNLLDTHVIKPKNIMPTFLELQRIGQLQNDLAKSILYSTWDHRFQADKPISANRKDKFFWFYESLEFEKLRQIHKFEILQRISDISDSFLLGSKQGSEIPVYINTRSPAYFVDTL
jgi:hypothetical protein